MFKLYKQMYNEAPSANLRFMKHEIRNPTRVGKQLLEYCSSLH
jgi:hypothetical protein